MHALSWLFITGYVNKNLYIKCFWTVTYSTGGIKTLTKFEDPIGRLLQEL